MPNFLVLRGQELEIRIKAVPGAARDEIVGVLGDRLKIRVSQPPEGGRANEGIRALLAEALGVSQRDIELVRGASHPMKDFRIRVAGAMEAVCARATALAQR